ncbi:hypothetical protein [Nocardioides sp. MH1]|uniref:hypothetical protein n=1 Tax=Nocardioides sp. MH1 TaxID=3242490 RepID=UPI0035214C05
MARARTPGIDGYLLAYVVSVACFALLPVALAVLTGPVHVEELFGILVVMAVYTTVCSAPFALVAIPVVHLLSKRCETQAGQVVATGAVTVIVVGSTLAVLTGSAVVGLGVGVLTACTTMTGRAAVIPLVRRPDVADFRPHERLHP